MVQLFTIICDFVCFSCGSVIVKIICDNVGYLKPIGVLLGSGK